VDYSLLSACHREMNQNWIPAKVQGIVMADEHTLALQIRTIEDQGWLYVSWHAQAARVTTGAPPERGEASEAFSFAQVAQER
jgi:predicted ribosome quality control (RQC) complex YloA/Tae2 family protein